MIFNYCLIVHTNRLSSPVNIVRFVYPIRDFLEEGNQVVRDVCACGSISLSWCHASVLLLHCDTDCLWRYYKITFIVTLHLWNAGIGSEQQTLYRKAAWIVLPEVVVTYNDVYKSIHASTISWTDRCSPQVDTKHMALEWYYNRL